MAFIDIKTNNQSRGLNNSQTFVDNWAYVPGTSKTGDYSKPYSFVSLQDFQDTCGIGSPEGSITYEYVSGLLSAGIPVIFRRIACVGQDTNEEVVGVTKAQTILTHMNGGTEVQDIRVSEKFGGTYGNSLKVSIRNTGVAYWLDVYYDYTLLERKKLITTNTTESQTQINTKLIAALQTTEFERITVEVLEEDPEVFSLSTVTSQALTGGTDFNESAVAAEIPASFNFIKDKILYQPKFITSGGYTDTDMSTASPIATAMLNLSLLRQDCRALIDIPIGTPSDEQQGLAEELAYQQLSDAQLIPSASICAPWQYMQVGAAQIWMPPSYVYLTVIGASLSKGGKVYTPKAGISNGKIANVIRPEFEIGSDLSEQWQSDTAVNINPIMKLQGGSYVIAGNSTLLLPESNAQDNNAFAESSSDLAILEIRRYVYNLATTLQYQYNAAEAFETFAISVSNFLNGMKGDGALTAFDIFNASTDADPRTLKIRLDVYLTPTIKRIEILLNVSYGSVELSTGGEG